MATSYFSLPWMKTVLVSLAPDSPGASMARKSRQEATVWRIRCRPERIQGRPGASRLVSRSAVWLDMGITSSAASRAPDEPRACPSRLAQRMRVAVERIDGGRRKRQAEPERQIEQPRPAEPRTLASEM